MSSWGVSRGLLAAAILALTFTAARRQRTAKKHGASTRTRATASSRSRCRTRQRPYDSSSTPSRTASTSTTTTCARTRTARSPSRSSATEDELEALQDAGYELGATIEGPDTWRARIAERQAAIKAEEQATTRPHAASSRHRSSHEDEIVVLRVDYFENYDGRFLSVEAKTASAASTPTAPATRGRRCRSRSTAAPARRSTPPPRVMNVNIDPDTTPDTYIEHRELVRIGDAGSTTPRRADDDPDRLEHRRVGRGARQHLARRRAAADDGRAS